MTEVPVADDAEPGPDAHLTDQLTGRGRRRPVTRASLEPMNRRGEKLHDRRHLAILTTPRLSTSDLHYLLAESEHLQACG
jgi:hypothetical protein